MASERDALQDYAPLKEWHVAISKTEGLSALTLVDDQNRSNTFFFPPSVADELSEKLAVNAHALRQSLGLPHVATDDAEDLA